MDWLVLFAVPFLKDFKGQNMYRIECNNLNLVLLLQGIVQRVLKVVLSIKWYTPDTVEIIGRSVLSSEKIN